MWGLILNLLFACSAFMALAAIGIAATGDFATGFTLLFCGIAGAVGSGIASVAHILLSRR